MTAIAAGGDTSLVVLETSEGKTEVRACGYGTFGTLGNGSWQNFNGTPSKVYIAVGDGLGDCAILRLCVTFATICSGCRMGKQGLASWEALIERHGCLARRGLAVFAAIGGSPDTPSPPVSPACSFIHRIFPPSGPSPLST